MGYLVSVAIATRLFDRAYDKEVFAQNSATKQLFASYLTFPGPIQHLLNTSQACASSWLLQNQPGYGTVGSHQPSRRAPCLWQDVTFFPKIMLIPLRQSNKSDRAKSMGNTNSALEHTSESLGGPMLTNQHKSANTAKG